MYRDVKTVSYILLIQTIILNIKDNLVICPRGERQQGFCLLFKIMITINSIWMLIIVV